MYSWLIDQAMLDMKLLFLKMVYVKTAEGYQKAIRRNQLEVIEWLERIAPDRYTQ